MNYIEELNELKNGSTTDDLRNICDCLSKLVPITSADEDERKEIMEKGGIKTIVQLVTHVQPAIQVRAVVVLLNLSMDATISPAIVKEGGLDATIALLKFSTEPQLCQYGFGMIRNLVKNEKDTSNIRGADLVDVVIRHMTAPKKYPQVISQCCAILGLLAQSKEICQEIIKQGGTKAFISVLREFAPQKNQDAMLATLAQSMQHLAYYNEEIAKEFHKYNAEKELSILIQHDNKNLQKQASNLIQIIAQTETLDLSKEKHTDELDNVISNLKSTDENKLYNALGVVWSFCESETNRKVFRERGVLEYVVKALSSQFAETLEVAAGAVGALALDLENQRLLTDMGTVQYLLRLLKVDDEPELSKNVITALGNMSYKNLENTLYIREKKILPRLIELMTKHKELGAVIAEALIPFANNDEGRQEIMKLGGLEQLVSLLKSKDKQTVLVAAACLWNMINLEEAQNYVYENGAFEIMTDLLAETDMSFTKSVYEEKEALNPSKPYQIPDDDEIVSLKSLRLSELDDESKKVKLEMAKYNPEYELTAKDSDEELSAESEGELQPAESDDEVHEAKSDDDEVHEAVSDDEENKQPIQEEVLQPAEESDEELKPEEDDDDDEEHRKQQMELLRKYEEQQRLQQKLLEEKRKRRELKRQTLKKIKQEQLQKKIKAEEEAKKKLEKKAENRRFAVEELLATEESYVAALDKVQQLYMKPLQTTHKGIITDKEFKIIFSDISLIHKINSNFLKELKEVMKTPNLYEDANEMMYIGELFLRCAPTFILYTNYMNNYDAQTAKIHEIMKQNQKFADFLHSVSEELEKIRFRQKDLDSLLITPIQRLPRYKLLLEEMLKNSPDPNSAGSKILSGAVDAIQKTTLVCNEKKRDLESNDQVIQLAKELQMMDLISRGRKMEKKIEENLTFVTYEKDKPTSTRSKRYKCKLYVMTDYVVLVRQYITRRVYRFDLAYTREVVKQVADRDREGKCLLLEDKNRIVFELKFADKPLRDEVLKLINDLRLKIESAKIQKRITMRI